MSSIDLIWMSIELNLILNYLTADDINNLSGTSRVNNYVIGIMLRKNSYYFERLEKYYPMSNNMLTSYLLNKKIRINHVIYRSLLCRMIDHYNLLHKSDLELKIYSKEDVLKINDLPPNNLSYDKLGYNNMDYIKYFGLLNNYIPGNKRNEKGRKNEKNTDNRHSDEIHDTSDISDISDAFGVSDISGIYDNEILELCYFMQESMNVIYPLSIKTVNSCYRDVFITNPSFFAKFISRVVLIGNVICLGLLRWSKNNYRFH